MWEIWLLIAITFAIAIIYYSSFSLLWFSIGALVALISSLFLHNLLVESIIFLIVSFILLLTLTKYFTPRFFSKKILGTTTDKLIGSRGIVKKRIGQTKLESGLVKLDGELWSAISETNTVIAEGSLVEVKAIKGVRLIVTEISH